MALCIKGPACAVFSEIFEDSCRITPCIESTLSPKAPRGLFFVLTMKHAQGFLLILFVQASFIIEAAFW